VYIKLVSKFYFSRIKCVTLRINIENKFRKRKISLAMIKIRHFNSVLTIETNTLNNSILGFGKEVIFTI